MCLWDLSDDSLIWFFFLHSFFFFGFAANSRWFRATQKDKSADVDAHAFNKVCFMFFLTKFNKVFTPISFDS